MMICDVTSRFGILAISCFSHLGLRVPPPVKFAGRPAVGRRASTSEMYHVPWAGIDDRLRGPIFGGMFFVYFWDFYLSY